MLPPLSRARSPPPRIRPGTSIPAPGAWRQRTCRGLRAAAREGNPNRIPWPSRYAINCIKSAPYTTGSSVHIADSARVTGAPSPWTASRRSSGSGCSHFRLGRCQAVGRLWLTASCAPLADGRAERSALDRLARGGPRKPSNHGSDPSHRLTGVGLQSRACTCRSAEAGGQDGGERIGTCASKVATGLRTAVPSLSLSASAAGGRRGGECDGDPQAADR